MDATFFFLIAPFLCYTTPPPPKKKKSFMPQAALSFTDMLNASDDILTSTPAKHYSGVGCFEPDSPDDMLYSPPQISLASGTTSTDTGTTSPTYIQLSQQYYALQLEVTILKRECHHLQYVLPTKRLPTILSLCNRLTHEDLVQAHKMLVATHAETIEANKSKWLRSEIAPPPAMQMIPPPSQLERSMYPRVWFWTKQDWRDYESSRKDSSDLVATGSA